MYTEYKNAITKPRQECLQKPVTTVGIYWPFCVAYESSGCGHADGLTCLLEFPTSRNAVDVQG